MPFISVRDFDASITDSKKENGSTIPWRELPVGEILYINDRKLIHLKDDTIMILTLTDKQRNTYVSWTPKRVSDELIRDYSDDDELYIRSNGLKQSKIDPTRSYYDYDIVKA